MRGQAQRALAWLPWLAAALLITAVLSPGMAGASRLVFQSPESPLPEATATETPVPVQVPPTATQPPAPKATQPPAPQATEPPAPTQAAPTEAAPAQATPATQATPSPTASPSPAAKATQTPAPSPTARPTRTPVPEPGAEGEATINWVKFWDTVVVWLAYPWMCCGVGLLLLVPVTLLYLEISGRRRPPLPPEVPPEPVGEEFAPDEEFDE